ncbi:MAG: response regulator [Candidatus Nanohalobium sp.]
MSLSVLLVDGDRQSLGLSARKLEEEGFRVFRAADFESAESVLESEKVDCIVTEYELPGKKGLEVCRGFRSRFSAIPLILFTSYRDGSLLQEAFESGVDDYVSKDLGKHRFSILADRIRSVVKEQDEGYSARIAQDLRIDDFDFLRQVVDVLPVGMVVRDADDRIVMANKYLESDQVKLDDIIGMKLEDTPLSDEQIRQIKENDREAIDKWDAITVEEEVVDENGERAFIESTKVPFHLEEGENPHLAAVFKDVTLRKKREKALERVLEADRKMAKADTEREVWSIGSEAMRDIFDLAISSGMSYKNGKFCPVGVTEDPEEYFDEEVELGPCSIASEVFESGRARFIRDMAEEEPYNPETPVESEVIVPVGDHGVLISGAMELREFDQADLYIADWLGNSVEASLDRVKKERKIRERDEKLERQTQQIDQFVKMLSHDLRNPLNVAQGYLDMVENSEELDQVEEALDRMEEIIQTILEMAKHTGKIEKGEFDLGEEARNAWKYDYVDRARLEVEDSVEIHANREQLRHLLENLFSNSLKHSEEEVMVRIGRTREGFYVEDDGPGALEEELEKILDFGYSSDGGTGLGLAIVDRIASFQGWDVQAMTSEEGGLRLEFRT